MSYKRKKLCVCKTNGNGLWTTRRQNVVVKEIQISISYPYDGAQFGEMRAFFAKSSWNIKKHGLIYTDTLWLADFRKYIKTLGFSDKALKDIGYSEQGLQGNDYVSLDVHDNFIKEQLNPVLRFVHGYTVKNDIIKVV